MATEETAVAPEVDEQSSGEGERERSTIGFPWADLDNAVRVAKGVHQVGGNSCQLEQLAAQLDVAIRGGAFRLMYAAAKTFGLVTLGQGNVTLTTLGQRVNDPKQEKVARAEAFLTVPLYRVIYDSHKGGTLPPITALETEMVTLGVAKKSAGRVRQVFQKSAQQAGFSGFGTDRLIMPATGPGAPLDAHKTNEDEKPPDDPTHKSDGSGGGRDPLIDGLIKRLPTEGAEWSLEDRHRWLQLAAGIFEYVYKYKNAGSERRVLTIDLKEASAK